ncbi:glycosyltransferase family 4 protein [Nisaea acidiphila]|uniref:Glycosyltransferase family 4 protein n=1 Tax=Nisaea acidiphila TaxID=1862145 RepID=A0A9J7AN54_9PROT|nr:glycosyltransferase family 4 protein [Nisaea acidiphila]UUX48009.1 glycosyltransferase family 4 protein [Nisaea acidiphila]
MARLLMAALCQAGHEVILASRLRSRDGKGDPDLQRRIAERGIRFANRFADCCEGGKIASPDLWFTYHLYYKAPDHIGPRVAERLGIPYVAAEASNAPKRAVGPWAASHARIIDALGRTDLVVGFNSRDKACLLPCLGPKAAYLDLKPFVDGLPYPPRPSYGALARELGLAEGTPILLAVGMMRPGAKTESYALLAEALRLLPQDRRWALVIAGDGPARVSVERAFAPLGACVQFLGAVDPARLTGLYLGADILAWPAINEAFGMALLEAQAAGLPVVAGDVGGVPDIVTNGETGLLSPEGDAQAFAANLDLLLTDPARARRMGTAAREQANRLHSLEAASACLDEALGGVLARHGAGR